MRVDVERSVVDAGGHRQYFKKVSVEVRRPPQLLFLLRQGRDRDLGPKHWHMSKLIFSPGNLFRGAFESDFI